MAEIIAELCQNHNGDIKILEEMVHAASESGADYAKIQSLHSSELTHRERFDNGINEGGRTKVIKRPFKNEYERLKKLDLDKSDHETFLGFCKKFKIKPLTTVFTLSKIDMIEELNFDTVKISSFDCASHRLVEEVAKKPFSKIIVSTGATFNREIKETINILNKYKKNFSLLHCVSIYPTPLEDANLSRINYLKKIAKSVGVSDHSNPEKSKNLIPAVSFYMGIDVIEKHFTILDKDKTKDGPVSVNPEQLKELVNLNKMTKEEIKNYIDNNIEDYNILLGQENRDMTDTELLNRDYYQGRFASTNIAEEIIYNWDKDKVI